MEIHENPWKSMNIRCPRWGVRGTSVVAVVVVVRGSLSLANECHLEHRRVRKRLERPRPVPVAVGTSGHDRARPGAPRDRVYNVVI